MTFNTWRDMYDYISAGNDIWNSEEELYVFVYNDAGALCYYNIASKDAAELTKIAKDSKEYWAAFLGLGGWILDDDTYNRETENDLYLEPSYNFCKEHFNKEGWVTVVP